MKDDMSAGISTDKQYSRKYIYFLFSELQEKIPQENCVC